MRTQKMFIAVLILCGTLALFQNCSQVRFSTASPAALNFSLTPGGGGSGSGTTTGSGDGSTIPLRFDCSNKGVTSSGYDLESVAEVAVLIYQVSGQGSSETLTAVPSGSENYSALRSYIMNYKAVPIPTNLGAGTYMPLVCPVVDGSIVSGCNLSWQNGNLVIGTPDLAPNTKFGGGYTFSISSSGALSQNGGPLGILLDTAAADDSSCDQTVSPLMIHLGASGGVTLSSPEDGVNFDILNNGTHPRISWPVNPEVDVFVALPDADGAITSSQQLFGNATVGPDGKTAANGFLALAKYALPGARTIDARTPIFSSLRLWADVNRDGVVEKGELFTLAEKNISVIYLDDSSVSDVDPYGNQVSEQSSVRAGGGLLPIFDVWFNLDY